MGANERKKRQLDKQKKLERMVLKTYYDFQVLEVMADYRGYRKLLVYPSRS